MSSLPFSVKSSMKERYSASAHVSRHFAALLPTLGTAASPTEHFGPPAGWEPHARQREFLAVDADEALYGGAAGGGKTAALLLDALRDVHVPGFSALILRRTRPELTQADGPVTLSHEWLDGTSARWNGTDFIWRFPSGARLAFGYLQDPQDHLRYQGGAYQFVGFDELTQIREAQYRYLFSRVRKRTTMDGVHPRVRATANPGGPGHNWVKARFGLRGTPTGTIVTHDADTGAPRVFVPARLDDNPGLDKQAYRKNLRVLDPVVRAQLEDGNWDVVPGGSVFTAPAQTYRTLPTEGLAYGIGIDIAATPGGGDWSVAVVMGRKWVPDNGVKGHWRLYVVEVVRQQVAQPEFGKTLALLFARYPTAVRRAYVSGGDIVADQWMRVGGVNIGAVPTGRANKLTRALPFAAAWNGRDADPDDPTDHGDPPRVYVPEDAPWVADYLAEHRSFTGDRRGHDDQVDASAAAFDVLNIRRTTASITTAAPRVSSAALVAPGSWRGGGM